MAKLHKLTARQVETAKRPGRYSDGGDLYLKVRRGGSKQWVMMWARMIPAHNGGQRRQQVELSLGPAGPAGLSLSAARKKAAEIRAQRLAGLDPKAERQKVAGVHTFGEIADAYITAHAASFKSAKHISQWRATLGDTYCAGLRGLPINAITTEHVLEVLKPIWQRIPETASRIRGRIEKILASAIATHQHPGPNPAIWKGHLETLLPRRAKLSRGHHAALPYAEMAAFIADLRSRESITAKALELAILTACRSGEVLGARWDEIDLAEGLWVIPAARMKAKITHRVTLSPRVVELLDSLPRLSEYIFFGQVDQKPLSNMAMLQLLRRMGREDITVHGFRSSFRDWAAEKTNFPATTVEHALAHRISDRAEAAYRRGDELEKRRQLLAAWAEWCEPAATLSCWPGRCGP